MQDKIIKINEICWYKKKKQADPAIRFSLN